MPSGNVKLFPRGGQEVDIHMEKRKRGILNFITEQSAQPQVIMVPLEKIEANPQQPRKIFKDEGMEELTGSIKEFSSQ